MEVTFAGMFANECPFCGGNNLAWEALYHNQAVMWSVVCRNDDCFAQGPIDLGKSGAIAKWNMEEDETSYNRIKKLLENTTNEKYTPPIVKPPFDIPFDYQNDQDKG